MGTIEAKPSPITYEEAVKRVTNIELQRIREAFKKSASPGGTFLSLTAFLKEVLFEGVPTIIGEWLFDACRGTQKGISFKDLLCGLVIITKGTDEEKTKFLWNLYCNEDGSYIQKSEMFKALLEEFKFKAKHCNYQQARNDTTLITLFEQSDRVTFDRFQNWISSNRYATIFSSWLFSEQKVKLTSEQKIPSFYQSLAGVTHLEEQEIVDIEHVFWNLKSTSLSGQIDLKTITPLINYVLPAIAVVGFFNAFDENQDAHIDFKELCCGVSAACRGPYVERSKFCFKMFDYDRDGVLNFTEIKQMINILADLEHEKIIKNNDDNTFAKKVLIDVIKYAQQRKGVCLQALDFNEDANLSDIANVCFTQEDFMLWSIQSSLNILSSVTNLICEICHLVFGLPPQCSHIEFNVVMLCLSREKRQGYKVGHFWYLIAGEWWRKWLRYTQYNSMHCAYCKMHYNIDESRHRTFQMNDTISCNEMFKSYCSESMGSHFYLSDFSTLGFKSREAERQCNSRPGPIDNTNLVKDNPSKNVIRLTGEGGQLKTNTPITRQNDFELVPELIWRALSRWYGYSIALPRQVIHPTDSMHPEVELSPINLQILRHKEIQSTTSPESWDVASDRSVWTTSMPCRPQRSVVYVGAFSRLATIKQITAFLADNLSIKRENSRLWRVISNESYHTQESLCLLEEENMSLQQLSFCDGDKVLLEVRNNDLTWPEELCSIKSGDRVYSEKYLVHTKGVTGLHNLGNTCFINAALQVLFNTKPLTIYFMKNFHYVELNTTSKLGTKGQLALRYGELLKEIWMSNKRSIAPLELYICIKKYAPQFADGGQHDAQELFEWLLDALHEDLNRVTEETYMQIRNSAGKPDGVVAAEAWSDHCLKNQSIIIDLFYGQFKSKVRCLSCGQESVRFDPFNLLSLPLPVENFLYCEVLVILQNGCTPLKYGIQLSFESKYRDLKESLSLLCKLQPKSLLICEIHDSKIKNVFHDEDIISNKSYIDLVAYQVPDLEYEFRPSDNSMIQVNLGEDIKQLVTDAQSELENIEISTIKSNYCEAKSITDMIDYEKETVKLPTSEQFLQKDMNLERTLDDSGLKVMPKVQIIKDNNKTTPKQVAQREHRSNCSDSEKKFFEHSISSALPPTKNKIIRTKKTFVNITDCNTMYLVGVHRKLIIQDAYFLSYQKTQPHLFGIPLLIPSFENQKNQELYCSVWVQVNRLLSPLPSMPEQANHAADCDDSLGYDFPFTLRIVDESGLICALCPWSKFCWGCQIPSDDELFQNVISKNLKDGNELQIGMKSKPAENCFSSIYIAIDWDPTALHLRYQTVREKLWIEHESMKKCKTLQTESISLDDCLQAFTSEEILEQWYDCSHCKEKKKASKEVQIWKLPPILVIHLKRFNFVDGKWVKSKKIVNFSFENFELTPYLASEPPETISHLPKSSELNENCNGSNSNERNGNCFFLNDVPNPLQYKKEHILNNVTGRIEDCNEEKSDMSSGLSDETKNQILKEPKKAGSKRLDRNCVNIRKDNEKMKADPFDLRYDLYAAVAHSGLLNGGHYVSYAANQNGSWFCYNDSSCRKIYDRPNIDPRSVYLLLYERKNFNLEPYFLDIEENSLTSVDYEGIENERKNCAIV